MTFCCEATVNTRKRLRIEESASGAERCDCLSRQRKTRALTFGLANEMLDLQFEVASNYFLDAFFAAFVSAFITSARARVFAV